MRITLQGWDRILHHNSVRKFIPTQAMKDAKAAVEWIKLETFSVVVGESQEQKGGHEGGTEKQHKVHFASLMDLCHLQKPGVGATTEKGKRVVLRGDL